jgi:MFS family permease
LISDVQIIVTCLAIVAGATVFSGIEPTLPVYLAKSFGLSASSIGLVWMAIVMPNMISSIIWGKLSDQYGRKNITALGLVLFAASSLVLALPKSLWALILALIAFGFSAAIVLTPGLPEMADYCEEKGGGIYAQGYALYNIAYSVGMIIGPLMGGYLFQELGFGWQMFVFSGILILVAPVVFLYYLRRTRLR